MRIDRVCRMGIYSPVGPEEGLGLGGRVRWLRLGGQGYCPDQ